MAHLKRSMRLSPTSVGKLIEHLETEYREKRKREIILDFFNKIKDDLVEIIRNNIEKTVESRNNYDGMGILKEGIAYHIDTKNLEMILFTDNNSDNNYAAYVEFGTGVVGATGAQNPQASKIGWRHDVNQHGEYGWVYYDEQQDRFRWTKGQEAARFMDFSVLDIQSYLDKKYQTYQYRGGAK